MSCLYISFPSTLHIRSIISAFYFFIFFWRLGLLTIFLPYLSLHISFLFKTSKHFKEVFEKMTKLYVFKLSCLLLPQNTLLRCPRSFSLLSQRAESLSHQTHQVPPPPTSYSTDHLVFTVNATFLLVLICMSLHSTFKQGRQNEF